MLGPDGKVTFSLAGTLRIDGRDIRSFDLRTYRRRLGIVSQTPFLFAGTVADNIRYAVPGLGDDAVERIKKQIQALKSQLNSVASHAGSGNEAAVESKVESLEAQIASLEAQLAEAMKTSS